ncbi:MAG TPA: c-type cytochrome [Gammaproteobacteria bacterium]
MIGTLRRKLGFIVSFVLTLASSNAGLAADPENGRTVFAECAACHTLAEPTGEEALGPSLEGLLGATAGSRDDYRYSAAMRRSGIVWTPETLEQFIADPQGLVRGNRMAFAGISDETARADLLAYLAQELAAE